VEDYDRDEDVLYEDVTGWILIGHLICGISGFLAGIATTIAYLRIFGG